VPSTQRGDLHARESLTGDSCRQRGARDTADGTVHPARQVAVINRRFLEAGLRGAASVGGTIGKAQRLQ